MSEIVVVGGYRVEHSDTLNSFCSFIPGLPVTMLGVLRQTVSRSQRRRQPRIVIRIDFN